MTNNKKKVREWRKDFIILNLGKRFIIIHHHQVMSELKVLIHMRKCTQDHNLLEDSIRLVVIEKFFFFKDVIFSKNENLIAVSLIINPTKSRLS